MDHLKAELLRRNLKCGGNLNTRSERLLLGLQFEDAEAKSLADPTDQGAFQLYEQLQVTIKKARLPVAAPPPTAASDSKTAKLAASGSAQEPPLKKQKKAASAKKRPLRNMAVHEPSESVYVCNLGYNNTNLDMDIRAFFKDAGVIVDTNWLVNKDTKAFLGRGFCNFQNTAQATLAVAMHGQDFQGRQIELGFAPKRKPRAPTANGQIKFVDKPLSARPDNCMS